ncbi:unnamed protein product, partial [Hymenolepis diminuta]
DNEEFFDECLREHNKYRKLHGVEPLRHSIALDKTAQEWAETLLQKEAVTNSPLSNKGEIGESISKRTSTSREADISGSDLISQWYNDIRSYDFESGSGAAGNFTQMVWAATREVGFGKARDNRQCVVVAHYRPPGNVRGRYKSNVFRKIPSKDDQVSNTNSDNVTKRTVSREKRIDGQGKERIVIREVVDTTDASGYIHRRVIESFEDDNKAMQQNGVPSTSHQVIPFEPSKQSLLEFSEEMLKMHNRYRRLHCAPDLVLSERLNAMAQEWAEFLVEEMCLSNSGFTLDGLRLGENITSRWSNGELEESASDVVTDWYQESSRFKYGREPVSIQGIGNFTQLVWSSSHSLGVGRAIRIARNDESAAERGNPYSSKIVVVCFYFPPGNVASYFTENVHIPLAESKHSEPSTPTPSAGRDPSFTNVT